MDESGASPDLPNKFVKIQALYKLYTYNITIIFPVHTQFL